jgi:hypothetical protein
MRPVPPVPHAITRTYGFSVIVARAASGILQLEFGIGVLLPDGQHGLLVSCQIVHRKFSSSERVASEGPTNAQVSHCGTPGYWTLKINVLKPRRTLLSMRSSFSMRTRLTLF